ncbi:MAG: CrcB family protein [Actinomycetota bacterium]|nr:CrcB family protein [Actinomycetota bacterium]
MTPLDSGDNQFAAEAYLLLRTLARPRAAVRQRVPLAWRRRAGVAAGGLVGTALRAAVAAGFPVDSGVWPWGTFVANLTGTLLLGYLLTRFLVAAPRTTLTIPLLCVGVLGSYTTFSTFVVEVARLIDAGRPAVGVAYGLVSIAVGFPVAQLGIRLAEQRR